MLEINELQKLQNLNKFNLIKQNSNKIMFITSLYVQHNILSENPTYLL